MKEEDIIKRLKKIEDLKKISKEIVEYSSEENCPIERGLTDVEENRLYKLKKQIIKEMLSIYYTECSEEETFDEKVGDYKIDCISVEDLYSGKKIFFKPIILGRKKDGSDSSNDDHLGTRNTAGEGN